MNLVFTFLSYACASTCNWEDNIEVTCSQKEMKISLREHARSKCLLNNENQIDAYITNNNVDLCKVGPLKLLGLKPPESGNLLDEEHLKCITIDETDQEVLHLKTNLIIIDDSEHSTPISCRIGILNF